MLACKDVTLPALLVWFHHNLAGFLTPAMIFAFFEVLLPLL
jgi:hypothetical protein